jgi:integrase
MTAAAPLPSRDGAFTVAELCDAYMARYTGRDVTRSARLSFWRTFMGDMPLSAVDDDAVHRGAVLLADQPARYYAGLDADGRAIYKSRGKPRSPATVNRYLAALSAVFTWAVRARITPKGFIHPVRDVAREKEPPGRTRYLSDAERARLLQACKASSWPRMYLFCLMAITTGARRGELLALRWGNIDLGRKVAYVERSKNADKRTLPLVAAAIEQLQLFAGKPEELVFPAQRNPAAPMGVDAVWRKALEVAKLRGVRVHDMRHTTASYLAQSGASSLEIGAVLGHRSLAAVKRYSHLNAQHSAALVERVMGGIG